MYAFVFCKKGTLIYLMELVILHYDTFLTMILFINTKSKYLFTNSSFLR